MPPFRAVNHEIPLKDPDKQIKYRAPSCPEAMLPQLMDKVNEYQASGKWVPCTAKEAIPLLCIRKKNGTLRTPIDARQRNDNTYLDVTPLPNQDMIRDAVARAKYRSKIDMKDAFEQIRIIPEHVKYTTFATVFGTFQSEVLQIGDLNGPSTMQRLMTWVFKDRLAKSVYVYLDDIFVFSNTIEDHEDDLRYVLTRLREERLFIAPHKLEVFADRIECLGHIIDDKGLHADLDKMSKIRDWQRPKSYKDIERFLGLVQYLQMFMPDVSTYSGTLSGMCAVGRPFVWRDIHQKCFEMIKSIACRSPILRPLDATSGEPIWIIGDASTTGVGALLGQGSDWKTCRPAGFMSKKFSNAQRAYYTYEHETLALLEALLKWEDKLLGRKITLVTDHKALEFFTKKDHRAPRQIRWAQFLARFDTEIIYVKGMENKVADCLSRYYESDSFDDLRHPYEYVTADIRLDREGDDLPHERFMETVDFRRISFHPFAVALRFMTRAQRQAQDRVEPRDEEAAALAAHRETSLSVNDLPQHENPSIVASDSFSALQAPVLEPTDDILNAIKTGYAEDKWFRKIKDAPKAHSLFEVTDDLIYTRNARGEKVLCIPSCILKKRRVPEIILDHAHTVIGHKGAQRTSEYVRRFYWWPRMGNDIYRFCESCAICATTKTSNKRPQGLLHSLPIPRRPWDSVAMDFVGPFPLSQGFDYLLVVTDRLTSMCHLLPTHTTVTATSLAWIYLRDIIRLHGTPATIVSDRDSKFTALFWQELHRLLGSKLLMSTAFHPQTDGTSERKIRDVSAALRTVVKPDQSNWVEKLPMVEFALNSSLSQSLGMAPFEANLGFLPVIETNLPHESNYPGVKEFVSNAVGNFLMARDAIIESRVNQTHFANRHREQEPPFKAGDKVYLSTANLNLPKGRASKLLPKYVGPYEILEAHPDSSTYRLELPDALQARRIHPVFHASLLRKYVPNDEILFPHREDSPAYDFGTPDAEYIVEAIIGHKWKGKNIMFDVKWAGYNEITTEPRQHVDRLNALDVYLELNGVTNIDELPRNRVTRRKASKRS